MKRQSDVRNLLTKWGPILVNTYDGIPYGMAQLSRNIVTTSVELILAVGIALVSLKNRSAIITTG